MRLNDGETIAKHKAIRDLLIVLTVSLKLLIEKEEKSKREKERFSGRG